jgi:hypothetical protein
MLIPLPFKRNCVSDCVPGGILSLAFFPSIVGTSTSPPRIAVVIEIGIWQKIFSSSLSNNLSFCTSTKIYKSPFPAPLCPGSPSPDIRILVPVSTPAGIVTEIVFCFLTVLFHYILNMGF